MRHSFQNYCKDYENIENYYKAKADNFKGWECHHRLETHTPDGKRREVDISHKELKALGMYYHRPAEELIFLTISEHHKFNEGRPAWNKGVPMSNEQKKKLSDVNKGKHLSEETIKKVSEANRGKKRSAEARKKMSEAKKGNKHVLGMHWYNNGKINKRAKERPDGFVPGRLK